MKNKIAYFMARDTRLILDNLSKIVLDDGDILIEYIVLRRSMKDEKTIAVKYKRSRNTLLIYDKLKKYNERIYNGFIQWAIENKIKWMSLGEVVIDER